MGQKGPRLAMRMTAGGERRAEAAASPQDVGLNALRASPRQSEWSAESILITVRVM